MKTARRAARELAMQGIFQWQFNRELSASVIEVYLQERDQFKRADKALFCGILYGVLNNIEALSAKIAPYYDRSESEVRPLERAVLLIGVYELLHYPQTPHPVIIDEAVELTKHFGGTDGYKFVNGILDKLALAIRPHEATLH